MRSPGFLGQRVNDGMRKEAGMAVDDSGGKQRGSGRAKEFVDFGTGRKLRRLDKPGMLRSTQAATAEMRQVKWTEA